MVVGGRAAAEMVQNERTRRGSVLAAGAAATGGAEMGVKPPANAVGADADANLHTGIAPADPVVTMELGPRRGMRHKSVLLKSTALPGGGAAEGQHSVLENGKSGKIAWGLAKRDVVKKMVDETGEDSSTKTTVHLPPAPPLHTLLTHAHTPLFLLGSCSSSSHRTCRVGEMAPKPPKPPCSRALAPPNPHRRPLSTARATATATPATSRARSSRPSTHRRMARESRGWARCSRATRKPWPRAAA